MHPLTGGGALRKREDLVALKEAVVSVKVGTEREESVGQERKKDLQYH